MKQIYLTFNNASQIKMMSTLSMDTTKHQKKIVAKQIPNIGVTVLFS